MLSMYKDSSGQTVVGVTGCQTMREVKIVKIKNLGLTAFDQEMFSDMPNVEELDISCNRLDIIPEINLPNLKRLDCSKNRFTDLFFLKQFPKLEEIDLKDNSVAFSDFCIASVLCPALKRINKQELNVQSVNQKFESRLKPMISKVWMDHFQESYAEATTNEEFEALGDKFRLMLKHATFPGTKLLEKFKDFKLAQLIDQFLTAIRDPSGMDLQPYSMTGRVRRNYNSKQASSQLASVTEPMNTSTTESGDTASSLPNHKGALENGEETVKELVPANAVITSSHLETLVEEPDDTTSTLILVTDENKMYETESGMVIVFSREAGCNDVSSMIYVTKEGFTDGEGNLIQEIVLEDGKPLILPDKAGEQVANEMEVRETSEVHAEEAITTPQEDAEESPEMTKGASPAPEAELHPESPPQAQSEVEIEAVTIPVPRPQSSLKTPRWGTNGSENSEATLTKIMPRNILKENSNSDPGRSQLSRTITSRPSSSSFTPLKQKLTRKIRREVDKPQVVRRPGAEKPVARSQPPAAVTIKQPMEVRRESRLLARVSNSIPVLPKRPISQLAANNLNEQNQNSKVKFWLYDEEIKPLRKKPRDPPPTTPKSKKRNLSKYIVGPASQFSLINRLEAAARNAAAAEGPQSENRTSGAAITAGCDTQQAPATYTRKPNDRLVQDTTAAAESAKSLLSSSTNGVGQTATTQSSANQVNNGQETDPSILSPAVTQQEPSTVPPQDDVGDQPIAPRGPPKKRVRFLDEANQLEEEARLQQQHVPVEHIVEMANEEIGVN